MLRLPPHAYCYLRHPILSSGETMLQYAIQHLCFTGAIKAEKRRVPAHARDPHLVTRLLLTRRDEALPTTRAEGYALGLFPVDRAISLGQLRGKFKEEDTDFESFKWDQLLPDLLEAGLLRSKYARTEEGRSAMEAVRRTRKLIDRRIDQLVTHDRAQFIALIGELDSNMVLLKQETRDKLRGLVKEIPELALTMHIGGSMEAVTAFHSFDAFDALSASDSFTSSDFGGFGDGDAGGGGDGGDW